MVAYFQPKVHYNGTKLESLPSLIEDDGFLGVEAFSDDDMARAAYFSPVSIVISVSRGTATPLEVVDIIVVLDGVAELTRARATAVVPLVFLITRIFLVFLAMAIAVCAGCIFSVVRQIWAISVSARIGFQCGRAG